MAGIRVPRYNESQIDTKGVATPNAQGLGPTAFGGGLAKGFNDLSADMAVIQQDEERKADISASLNARIAFNKAEYDVLYGDEKQPGFGVLKKKGLSAAQDEPLAMANFNKIAGEIEKNLGTEKQKLAFKAMQSERLMSLQHTLGGHSRKEMDWHNDETLKATEQSSLDRIGTLYDKPDEVEKEIQIIKFAREQRLDQEGVGKDPESALIRTNYMKDAESKARKVVVTSLMNNGDFVAAGDYLAEHKGSLNQDDYTSLEHQLRPAVEADKADTLVNDIWQKYAGSPYIDENKMYEDVKAATKEKNVRTLAYTELQRRYSLAQKAEKEKYDYNYGQLATEWELNPNLSLTQVMKLPAFRALDSTQQGKALADIRRKISVRDNTERGLLAAERSAAAAGRSAAAAERAATERQHESAYYYYRSRPEEFAAMSDDEFEGLRLKMGDEQFSHLKDDRKKANSPEGLADATLHANVINNTLDKIPGLDDSVKGKYFSKLKSAIRREQKRINRQLSQSEVETTVIENMQINLVKEKGLLGRTKEKRKVEIGATDTPIIPNAYLKRINGVAAKRGKVFSVKEQYDLYQSMLRSEGKK